MGFYQNASTPKELNLAILEDQSQRINLPLVAAIKFPNTLTRNSTEQKTKVTPVVTQEQPQKQDTGAKLEKSAATELSRTTEASSNPTEALSKRSPQATMDSPKQEGTKEDSPKQEEAKEDSPKQEVAKEDSPKQEVAKAGGNGQEITTTAAVAGPEEEEEEGEAVEMEANEASSVEVSETEHVCRVCIRSARQHKLLECIPYSSTTRLQLGGCQWRFY